jgi:hypothetical protein
MKGTIMLLSAIRWVCLSPLLPVVESFSAATMLTSYGRSAYAARIDYDATYLRATTFISPEKERPSADVSNDLLYLLKKKASNSSSNTDNNLDNQISKLTR